MPRAQSPTPRTPTTTGTRAGDVAPTPRRTAAMAASPSRGRRNGAATRAQGGDVQQRNEVRLRGRLAAVAEERELPSGDVIATFRVVVPRPPEPARRSRGTRAGRVVEAVPASAEPSSTSGGPAAPGPRRATVDTIDVVCWSAATRRVATRLPVDVQVEVEGALRRRFFGGPGGRQSRYEVEAAVVRRVSGPGLRGT